MSSYCEFCKSIFGGKCECVTREHKLNMIHHHHGCSTMRFGIKYYHKTKKWVYENDKEYCDYIVKISKSLTRKLSKRLTEFVFYLDLIKQLN